MWFHLEATLPRIGLGWVFGALLGLGAALAARRWQAARSVRNAIASTAAVVPALALMPLLVIWLGEGEAARIATIMLAAAIAAAGTAADDRPAAGLVAALHASLPMATVVLVAIEMVGGGFGIGALIHAAAELYRSDQIIAGCLVLAAIGIVLHLVLRLLDRAVDGGRSGTGAT